VNPGRELDALVAEKVMGLPKPWQKYMIEDGARDWFYERGLDSYGMSKHHRVPSFSTDIADAWAVVERLKDTHYNFQLENDQGEIEPWIACFGQKSAVSSSAPHAICLAALRTVGAIE
jgi:hypothetical protein